MAEASSPFIGLVPFTEEQSRFFFGRERETRLVINNLFASRLTLLYGPSGAGKSSLLLAGVKAQLAREARDEDQPQPLVVYMKEWQGPVMARFRIAMTEAICDAWPDIQIPSDESRGICGWLEWIAETKRDVDVFVLLDQFEEYFLYHSDESVEPFAQELATTVKKRSLPVSFLLGLRDDALARLDRFKAVIPDLFGNYLRVEPLSEEMAEKAIRKPIEVYNETAPAVEIEDELVQAVLEQVRKGEVEIGPGGRGRVAGTTAEIEAPYLQLVMTRIWDYEQAAGSSILRRATLKALGGAQKIVRDHLEQAMKELSGEDRKICFRMFQHLVAPSGTRIAHSAEDLAKWAKKSAPKVEDLLGRLSGPKMRILVSVAPVDAVSAERYQIYHESLGQAMLDWRGRAEIREWRLRVASLFLAVLVMLAFIIFAWVQWQRAEDNATRAERKEQEAQAKSEEVRRLLLDLQREREERAIKEASALELKGKVDEAEKLRAEAEESKTNLTRQLAEIRTHSQADVTSLQDRLDEMTMDRDKERERAEQAEGQLATVRATNDGLRREIKYLANFGTENGIGMRFQRIHAGSFRMGSPVGEAGRRENETLHVVKISRDFWVAETEVTQGQWRKVVGENPSHFADCGDNCPVENVNWFEAITFANRLSESEKFDTCYHLHSCAEISGEGYQCASVDFVGLDCEGYRLPTEAEWEYFARAGSFMPYWTGAELTSQQENIDESFPDYKSSKGIYRKKTTPVRSFDPNPWILYSVHGNVREWTWDRYGDTGAEPVTDPLGPEEGVYRVLRGGSWALDSPFCRSALRNGVDPGDRDDDIGFRLVRTYR